jgi:hypothetical protein
MPSSNRKRRKCSKNAFPKNENGAPIELRFSFFGMIVLVDDVDLNRRHNACFGAFLK